MPHSRSSRKRVRQNEKNRIANLAIRGAYRGEDKRVMDLLAAGKPEEAKVALSSAYQSYDKAAKQHVIHANNAANHKRKLAQRVARALKPAAKAKK
jgi:small subunit ribosomal protein S20